MPHTSARLFAAVAGTVLALFPAATKADPAAKRLEDKKPVAAPVRTDVDGEPLPRGAVRRLGSLRFRHAGAINAAAFSPDGKRLATAGNDDRVRLWDVETGRQLHCFDLGREGTQQGSHSVHDVAFSPDGKRLVATGENVHRAVWDATTGEELVRVRGGGRFLAFSPDGKALAVAYPELPLIQVWYGDRPRNARVVGPWNLKVNGLAVLPGGKVLGLAVDKDVILWDVAADKEIRRLKGHSDAVRALVCSPDGKVLASAGEDGLVILRNARTLESLWVGRRARKIRTLAFSRNGKVLAAAGTDGLAVLSAVDTGKELRRIPVFARLRQPLALSPDGRRLAAPAQRNQIRIWDTSTGKALHDSGGHGSHVHGVAVAPDGRTAATASDDGICLWRLSSGKRIALLDGHKGGVRCMAYAPDGRRLASAGQADGTICVWDPGAGKEILRIPISNPIDRNDGFCIAYSPDGKTLAAGNGKGTVHLFDAAKGTRIAVLIGHGNEPLYGVAFAPDGRTLASCGLEGGICLWEWTTEKMLRRLKEHRGWVMAVCFSPDGRWLASAGDANDPTVRLWEAATGKQAAVLAGHTEALAGLAFSPDGRTIASAGWDQVVRVWEVATARERCRFPGHGCWIGGVAFSPDGGLLASGAADTTALLWDVTGRFTLPPAALSAAALESLGKDLSGSNAAAAYGALRRMTASPDQAVAFLRARLRPAPKRDGREIERLLAALDSEEFAERERATRELEGYGHQVESALRRLTAGKASLETVRRAEKLLDRLYPVTDGEHLRRLRAVEVLEHIGTAEARKVLAALAKGAAENSVTREAKASLQRLARPHRIEKKK